MRARVMYKLNYAVYYVDAAYLVHVLCVWSAVVRMYSAKSPYTNSKSAYPSLCTVTMFSLKSTVLRSAGFHLSTMLSWPVV